MHIPYNHFHHSPSPCNIMKRGSFWGYKRFYMTSLLETSDYLKDDCLVMDLTIGVVRNRVETPTILVPPPDMGDCLEGLLKSGMNSDIVFEVGDETFRAHKLILAVRSPVFKAQFYGLIGNPDMEKIVVKDVQPLVFKAMLNFIYSDVLPDIRELTGSVSKAIYASIMQHLFVEADRYGLERLKLLCEAKLCELVSADTVASTMALAEQHQCAHLKSVCLKFTASRENLGDVIQTEEFEHLGKANPSLLLDLLATVAAVDDDTCRSRRRKRNWGSDIGLSLSDGVGSSGRQTPRHF
ncbi:BTB/POZ and MATH domain-containing protein 3-like [Iris pallida]|uniref:BTB/POZ and MATH domain-containing protein 3-like n=1 Tax=Iris pallida TaxID=29817 RepID=A0AAX6ET40_IRIPA|nr:BTB/POZ and MATH domain-containing protein 3-like [Iris pallida]KAJ6809845.1 BTB/POZ and MATH domain-containing protein 3-like [Iris pallida]